MGQQKSQASFVNERTDDWAKERRKAKRLVIAGLAMVALAMVVDYCVFRTMGAGKDFRMGDAFSYGFVAEYFLFPAFVAGVVMFVVGLRKFYRA